MAVQQWEESSAAARASVVVAARRWLAFGSLALGSAAFAACASDPVSDPVSDPASDSGPETAAGGSTEGSAESGEGASGTDAADATGTAGDAACGGAWAQGFAIPMPELPAGDPVAGYEALLTRDYVSCGIPWSLFSLAEGVLGVEEALPGRTGKNAEVGHAWTVVTLADESELVVSNCLQCHAGRFNGELIVGLGKADIDNTTPYNEVVDPLPTLPATSLANIAFNKFKARIGVLGPTVVMATIGANPAVMYAIALLAHRDPQTLAWSDAPMFELPAGVNIPADPPPWWRAAKKASHFANGMSRGDHRGTMILASSLCTDTVEEVDALLDYFTDIQAYLGSLEAPRYPFAIDEALAAEGAELFDCHCAGCHGTYDEDPALETFPNLLIPTPVVGTDAAFAEHAAPGGAFHHLEERFNDSVYGSITDVVTADPVAGYTAPPLDGIWATAPFLHNGSVPTLALVLDSQARPARWRRVDYDSTNFDQSALGWPWEASDVGQADAPEETRRFIYDTALLGYGNGGHTFGDILTADQRTALLEYLKTL